MTSSGLTASPSSTTLQLHHHHHQRQLLTSSSDINLTNVDTTTLPTTLVVSAGSITNISLIRIVLVALCSLGILFNGFVLFVLLYAKQSRRVSAKILITNQTLIDLLGCLSVIVNAVTTTYSRQYMKLPGAAVICILFESSVLISTCNNASITNLVVLTLERYFKIVHSGQEFR